MLMPIPVITSWKLESLRLSVFLAEPIDPNQQSWWKIITGLEPETTTSKRQTGEYTEDGVFGDWRLTLAINGISQNRVDWLAYPAVPDLISFSSIGNYVEESEKFYKLFHGWLSDNCPPAFRIAYGAVLLNEVADRRAGYEVLSACLPIIKFNSESWSDFSFQVNNRTSSNILTGMTLNILTKWNAIQMVRMPIDQTGSALADKHACRLELDLSSAADNKTSIQAGKLTLLYGELRTIADQYVSNGYPK